MRDYLVYTSAGHAANVGQWCSSPHRNYDIWITNYTGTGSLHKACADHYNEHKGSKFQNLKFVFDQHRELLAAYKAIMVADDDIVISPGSLSALFDTLVDHELWVLQPAFSRIGKISHGITRRRLNSALRYTNFVEVTCPVFRTDKLFEFLAVYRPELSTCFGIDWWYLSHFGGGKRDRYAVSDRYYCVNPRDYFKPGHRREIDSLNSHAQRLAMWRAIQREMGISSFKPVVYRQIPRSRVESAAALPGFVLESLLQRSFGLMAKMKKALS